MSATSYFVNKTDIIKNKYIKSIVNALEEYNKQNIKNKTEFAYYINIATNNFIKSMNTPLFEYKAARSVPLSEDFNSMINSAIDDIDILISEAVFVSDNINSINNEIRAYVDMFDNITSKLSKSINTFEDTINSIENNKHYIFSDTFDDNSKSTIQKTEDLCKIDFVNGFISINTKVERDFSNNILIEIFDDSNGFPGNTHQAEVLNNSIQFLGENEPYANIYNMTDGDYNTWFEYEGYKISDEQFLRCNGYGFNYKEGISWLIQDDKLVLNFKLYFEESKMCNWFSMSTFNNVIKNNKNAIVKKVIVTDCIYNTQEININKNFDDTIVITFEPQEVKEILISIEQPFAHKTEIGHFYSLKIDKNINIFDYINKNDFRRVEGYNPSVEALGITYDPNTKKYIQPKYTNRKGGYLNSNLIRKELFINPKTEPKQYCNQVEILEAFRYSISIKNIIVANYIFNDKGIYCSKPFTTTDNITSIELEADDYIPNSFIEADTQYHPNKYLLYEISFDNGNKWLEINPRSRVQYGPCAIYINSDVLPSMRNVRNIRYINRLLDTKNITLRITMQRPSGYIYDSPIVYNYKLNVITEDNYYANF